jgi:hypothetical protein
MVRWHKNNDNLHLTLFFLYQRKKSNVTAKFVKIKIKTFSTIGIA